MNGPTGEGNNGCEEILAFIVVGIGGIALLKKMAPKIIGHLGAWLRDHGLLGVPGQGLFDLGLLGSVSASHLVVRGCADRGGRIGDLVRWLGLREGQSGV